MDREQHFELLRESAAEISQLEAELQNIRDQEAALQSQRVSTIEKLKKARSLRMDRMNAAIDENVPKAQIARASSMDRTNLYKLLAGKADNADA